jgi:hypothetical protein
MLLCYQVPVRDAVGRERRFDAERSARGGHADGFWAIALACQKERGPGPSKGVEIGVPVLGSIKPGYNSCQQQRPVLSCQ